MELRQRIYLAAKEIDSDERTLKQALKSRVRELWIAAINNEI